jgi:hypothetical protein
MGIFHLQLLDGFGVSKVVLSKNPDFKEGDCHLLLDEMSIVLSFLEAHSCKLLRQILQ